MQQKLWSLTGVMVAISMVGAVGPMPAGSEIEAAAFAADGRTVHPYNVTVLAHIPVAAGYEPFPTPQHCLEKATVTGAFYTEDFEGAHGYTFVGTSLAPGADNLWQATTWAGPGSGTGHSASTHLYYGDTTSGDYDFGHTAGAAQSPQITTPASGNVFLSFATKWQTEWLKGYDHLFVEALDMSSGKIHLLCTSNAYDRADPAGGFGQTVIPSCSPYHFNPCPLEVGFAWEKRFVQMPAVLMNKNIKLRFTFDSADDKANIYMGWMVDDVVLGTGVTP